MSTYQGYPGGTAPAAYNPVASLTDGRAASRTPSPTPSEIEALNQNSLVNLHAIFQRDKLLSKRYLIYYAVIVVIVVVGTLFLIYDKQIVHAVQPAANWMHGLPGGWLIPIGIFFIISFPPLFGHEILAIVCGLVWGVWAGFGITAAGTLLGEIGNFYAFRYLFHSRAEKEEKKSIQYACLAKLVREGGFKIAVIVRYSAVPGHFTTAIFAVCGMNIFIFVLAAVLSMPKQFITVYIGTLLESSASGTTSTKNSILSYVVSGITIIVTVAAMWYIRKEINRVKPDVVRARQKARQAKLNGDSLYQNSGMMGSTDDTVFNPNASDASFSTSFARSDSPYDSQLQHWDRDGRAMGYATDPRVFAPQPRRANPRFEASLIVPPSRSGSAAGVANFFPSSVRQESADAARWELQTNAADGQAYPLHDIPDPVEPLRNPFENASSETIVPPGDGDDGGGGGGAVVPLPPPPTITTTTTQQQQPAPLPPPARSSVGEYAFGSPRHSYQGGTAGNVQTTKALSPPPPRYRA